MYAAKDPHFVHYYRINVDGTGLLALTKADANHPSCCQRTPGSIPTPIRASILRR